MEAAQHEEYSYDDMIGLLQELNKNLDELPCELFSEFLLELTKLFKILGRTVSMAFSGNISSQNFLILSL